MKFNIRFILLLIAIPIGFIIIKKIPIAAHDTNTFIVGTAAGYAPFVSINAAGQYEGFDIDIAHALAKQMGKKLVLQDLGSMTSLFTALDQGTIDAIIWGLSITKDRLQKVAMVHYQGQVCSHYSLIFWQQIPDHVNGLADMSGKTVCIEPGSCQDAVLSKWTEIMPLPVEKIDDALLNIQYSKADAAFVEPAIAKKFQRIYPEVKIMDIPLDPQDQVHGIGIVLTQQNYDLMQQVQNAINDLTSTGLITNLEQKWGLS